MSFFTFWGRTVDGAPPGVALPTPGTSSKYRDNSTSERNLSVEDSSSLPLERSSYCPSVKVVIVGESSVGKSALAWRYCRGDFTPSVEPTVGAAFLWRIAEIPMGSTSTGTSSSHQDGRGSSRGEEEQREPHLSEGEIRRLKFEIWDTAGQERYRCLVPVYYRGAAAALVVYDVTDHTSFERCKFWIEDLRRSMSRNRVLIMLVGTKADRAEDRAVTAEEGAELAEQEMLAGFLETSSREDINVEELFTILGQLILEGFAASGEDCDESRNAGATRISAARLAETGNSAPERRSYFRCC